MTFLHPWLLLGAVAALIPLLVHLFDRRRPRPQPFAPLAFVLRSQKRTASRLKLKRLLLYALRTFLLVALPVAIARPECTRPETARVQPGPAATALLLDASLAMRYRDGGQTLFDEGRAQVRSAVQALRPEEPATLVVCGGGAGDAVRAPNLDRSALLGELEAAAPGYRAADMARCMDRAAHALEESPLAGKRLVVVSAFTARSFPDPLRAPTVKGVDGKPVKLEVVLRDVAHGKETLPNRSLTSLRVEPAPQSGPRTYQFTFSTRNLSPEALHDVTAQLRARPDSGPESVLARGFLDVPALGGAQKVFTHRFEVGGTQEGVVALSAEPKTDGLAEDDQLPFVLEVPTERQALLVNGAPSPVRQKDEAFFAEAALRAAGSPVTLTVRDSGAAWREDLTPYALVLLLNVDAPPPEAAERLQRFVEGGGGLFIALGDHVQADEYNARLGALLPQPLHGVKSATPDSAHLGEVDESNPLFALFTGAAEEGLRSARFSRYFLLEPARGRPAQVLAAFEDGSPALVESLHPPGSHAGRVALWTSTLDRDWTDAPIRTSFLPLLQRIAAQLTDGLDEHEPLQAQVGARLHLPASAPPAVKLRTPTGAALSLEGSLTPPLPMPGIYVPLDAQGKPVPHLRFAVALDPADSDLTRLSPEALSRAWGDRVTVASSHDAQKAALPAWTWVLLAAMVAFFAEGLLLRGGS